MWAVGLAPVALLLWRAWDADLGANPIDYLTRTLGNWTLRFLLASLTMTPLRVAVGWSWPISLRRLLGLFAFFYVLCHFAVWLVLDHFFDWAEMGTDIVKRPYVTAGMAALLLLCPLAATSTSGMIKRLGAAAWRRLHRLAYAAGVLGVLHFLWLAKVGRQEPYLYAGWLALVLGVRVWDAGRRRIRQWRRRRAAARAGGPARPPVVVPE